MKKIRLDVRSLDVLSFDAERVTPRRGTVRAAGPYSDIDPNTALESCIIRPYTGDDPLATCYDGCVGC